MSNVALITRQYGEGRICISAGSIGTASLVLPRRITEWVGQKFSSESIKIGAIVSLSHYDWSLLKSLNFTEINELTVHSLLHDSLSDYDLIYFIGLPDAFDQDVSERIAEYVRDGGGLLIDNPDRVGAINVLSSVESINVESIQRPSISMSYWTERGKTHYTHTPFEYVDILSVINNTSLSNSWSILMSDVFAQASSINANVTISANGQVGSEFGISYFCRMKHGLVMIEESL